MQILKKTHEKKLEIKNPISFSIDEIIESLEPRTTFIINDLFLYTINEDFLEIKFYLIVNNICVSTIFLDLKTEVFQEFYTKEIYKTLLKNNFENNKMELSNLKNLVTV
jgi:hypothetical protein